MSQRKTKVDQATLASLRQQMSAAQTRYYDAFQHLRDDVLPSLTGEAARAVSRLYYTEAEYYSLLARLASVELEEVA